ncbi:glycoside hydrolase family 32 protein [Ruficoccus amylovorans]|uniref:beta-fructofuranosidase n=1 Tax=Ruficoccus amylovorans TaxID=1804625 RepID=A0A842HI23_9BACT|nr:glycoside hydrolase family 32 protein [Ruficoccus amylovorans]MBC2595236.1 glycoside hydrolase family 32 protein [Ruficoccus amylovorans]
MKILPAFLGLTLSIIQSPGAQDHALDDFEGSDYGSWEIEGEAFAPGPQAPTKLYLNRSGNKLAMSRLEFSGDSATGTLTSPEFTIDRRWLHFLIGGGNHPDETCVELIVDGQVVRTAAGPSQKSLEPVAWDLKNLQGKTARLRLADRKTGRWGHIAADNFVLSNDDSELTTFALPADDKSDIVIADFEQPDYHPWSASGKAFSAGPYTPAASDSISGYEGKSLAKSQPADGSNETGSLLSPPFIISRPYLNFLIGGGDQAFRTALSLWIDGRIVRTSSGTGNDSLEWKTWDVSEFEGQTAALGIHDLTTGEEPVNYVLVDSISLSNTPKANHDSPSGSVEAAITQVRQDALNAIRRNQALAASDPYRPTYHYAPPSQRMNDPNGPAWSDGYHHLFYQHMVFVGHGSATNVHWGHARSRDLVNWETLPLAIRPLYENGELSVFSGNMAQDKHGQPAQFTTMVPYLPDIPRRIWIARPEDEDWITWTTTPASPQGLVPQGDLTRNIKDAFPFSAGDRRFLVLTDRTIPVYEAVNDDLTEWEYRGNIDEDSAECPNFFEVDGHWLYLASPHSPVRYRIGDFDPDSASFTPRSEGYLNHDTRFYASTLYKDDQGQTILLGVTRGQKKDRGWTGALAMPRVLSIGEDLKPRMSPPASLEKLRHSPFSLHTPVTLNDEVEVIEGLRGDTVEIMARFRAGDADSFGLQVRRSDDGSRFIPVMWKDGRIIVQRELEEYPCEYEIDPDTREVTFRIFLDKGILDACTDDGRVFESRIHYAPLEDLDIAVFAAGGSATLLSLDAWQMSPATIDHSLLLDSDQSE